MLTIHIFQSILISIQQSMGDFITINLDHLHKTPLTKSQTLEKIRLACKDHGFFNVVDHGVPDSVIEQALEVNAKFFDMPMEMKEELISDDVFKSVRFTSLKIGEFSSEFLKLYANPLDQFVDSWPRFPSDYREKMGTYSTMVRKVANELFGAIVESLDLHETHLKESFENGFQILGVNCYPPSLDGSSALKTGVPAHTDHSVITVLLQSSPGLQVVDKFGTWKDVPLLKGSFQVFVGNHLEVISNGLYKSVLHKAIPNCGDPTRLSIGNFQSLGMDDIVVPAGNKLENGINQTAYYKGSTLREYLNYLSSKDAKPFIDTLKINSLA